MTKTILVFLLFTGSLSAQAALDPAQVRQLAAEDSTEKVAAIRQLTQTADPDAVRVLKAMADDSLFLAGDKALIIDGDKAVDAITGKPVNMPANPESVTVNNRIRGELSSALAALKLFDSDLAVRLASAQKLQSQVTPEMAPLLARALEKEIDPQIKALLTLAYAQANLKNADPAAISAAVREIAETASLPSERVDLLRAEGGGGPEDEGRSEDI